MNFKFLYVRRCNDKVDWSQGLIIHNFVDYKVNEDVIIVIFHHLTQNIKTVIISENGLTVSP